MEMQNYIQFQHLIRELQEEGRNSKIGLSTLNQVKKAVEKHSDDLPNSKANRSLAEELSDIWTCNYACSHRNDNFEKVFIGVIKVARDRFDSSK